MTNTQYEHDPALFLHQSSSRNVKPLHPIDRSCEFFKRKDEEISMIGDFYAAPS